MYGVGLHFGNGLCINRHLTEGRAVIISFGRSFS